MARFSGPQFKGALRAHRAAVRAAAMKLQAVTDAKKALRHAGKKRGAAKARRKECA